MNQSNQAGRACIAGIRKSYDKHVNEERFEHRHYVRTTEAGQGIFTRRTE